MAVKKWRSPPLHYLCLAEKAALQFVKSDEFCVSDEFQF